MYLLTCNRKSRTLWNKAKIIGQKPPLKLRDIWAIRIRLQMENRLRDLALFNLAIDSKLRACDLVKLRLPDIAHGDQIARRAIVLQQKTPEAGPVRIDRPDAGIRIQMGGICRLHASDYLFNSRIRRSAHITTRQYARIADSWVADLGLDPKACGTH